MQWHPSPEQLRRLLADQLDRTERGQVETHVEGCDGVCRQRLEELVGDLPGESAAECPPPPEEFLQRLRLAGAPDRQAAAPPIRFPLPPTGRGPLGGLGPYEIVKEVGGGTFGVVFQAYDGLRRRVALKVLKPEFAASPRECRKFEEEARAAAAVRDDHVVTIHQIGPPDAAFPLPYFVMEYIDGESLDAWIETREVLPPREAAGVCLQAAQGLAAAHARGLVHRDVKPGNIMVEAATGRAKLTDFGLARMLEGEEANLSGRLVGTLGYMSPEQIRAPESVDARSDVYSLGVVLYELLTRRRPFVGDRHELLRRVLQDDPVPPRRLAPRTPRELQTVCLKCLEKDPRRRYGTAADVAAELRRFLAGEPIAARPVSPPARAWKWCRRNQGWAAVIAVTLLAAAAGAAGVVAHTVQLTRERNKAVAAREQADRSRGQTLRAARALVEKVAAGIEPLAGTNTHTVEGILHTAKGIYADLLAEEPSPQVEAARADMLNSFARIYISLYDIPKARQSAEEAASIFRRLSTGSADRSYADGLATAHDRLGTAAALAGKLQQAEREYETSRDIYDGLRQAAPGDARWQRGLALSLTRIGNVLVDRHEPARARECLVEAQRLRQSLADAAPDHLPSQQDLAMANSRLGEMHIRFGDYPAAIACLKAARETYQQLAAPDGGRGADRQALARVTADLGRAYYLDAVGRGDEAGFDLAEQCLLEARPVLEAFHTVNPENVEWERDLLRCLIALLGAAQREPTPESQQELARQYHTIADIARRQKERSPESVGCEYDVALTVRTLAVSYVQLANKNVNARGNVGEAIKLCAAAQELLDRLVRFDPANRSWAEARADTREMLGKLYLTEGRIAEAPGSWGEPGPPDLAAARQSYGRAAEAFEAVLLAGYGDLALVAKLRDTYRLAEWALDDLGQQPAAREYARKRLSLPDPGHLRVLRRTLAWAEEALEREPTGEHRYHVLLIRPVLADEFAGAPFPVLLAERRRVLEGAVALGRAWRADEQLPGDGAALLAQLEGELQRLPAPVAAGKTE